jgi:hypothetical protein
MGGKWVVSSIGANQLLPNYADEDFVSASLYLFKKILKKFFG